MHGSGIEKTIAVKACECLRPCRQRDVVIVQIIDTYVKSVAKDLDKLAIMTKGWRIYIQPLTLRTHILRKSFEQETRASSRKRKSGDSQARRKMILYFRVRREDGMGKPYSLDLRERVVAVTRGDELLGTRTLG